MLSTTVITLAVLLGLAAALVFRRLTPPRWLTAGGAVALAGGVALSVLSATSLVDQRKHLDSWPGTTATVITSDVVGERAFHVVLTLEYQVEEMTYQETTSIAQPAFGGKNKRLDVARKTLAQYPPGHRMAIQYNSANPREILIGTSVFWSVYGKIGFGFSLIGLGVCLLLMRLLPKPRPSSEVAA